MSEINIKNFMQLIPENFDPEKAKGVSGVVQCSFSGEQASSWVLTIKDQTCSVVEGKTTNPDLTIEADAEEGINLLSGKSDPMRAFMAGKIKVYGNLALGMKFMNLFNR